MNLSQLTIIALILLVAGLWKFGPWNRKRRILSYEFPSGWWQHVALIAPDWNNWEEQRKRKITDYIRLFVDRVEFNIAPSLKEEFEIRHRIAFATQAFLLFENFSYDPIEHIDRFYVQKNSDEIHQELGMARLFWEEKRLNYITFFEVSKLSGSLPPYILGHLEDYLLRYDECDPEARIMLEKVLGAKYLVE